MKTNVTTVTKQNPSTAMWTLFAYFGALVALFFISDALLATSSGGGGKSLGDVADTVTTSMKGVGMLITAASYVAGVGFAMMGMLKFKAHKDNPTQVPLSQPIVLLAIAAGLVFLPNLITTGGATVWGDEAANANAAGEGVVGMDAGGSSS